MSRPESFLSTASLFDSFCKQRRPWGGGGGGSRLPERKILPCFIEVAALHFDPRASEGPAVKWRNNLQTHPSLERNLVTWPINRIRLRTARSRRAVNKGSFRIHHSGGAGSAWGTPKSDGGIWGWAWRGFKQRLRLSESPQNERMIWLFRNGCVQRPLQLTFISMFGQTWIAGWFSRSPPLWPKGHGQVKFHPFIHSSLHFMCVYTSVHFIEPSVTGSAAETSWLCVFVLLLLQLHVGAVDTSRSDKRSKVIVEIGGKTCPY